MLGQPGQLGHECSYRFSIDIEQEQPKYMQDDDTISFTTKPTYPTYPTYPTCITNDEKNLMNVDVKAM